MGMGTGAEKEYGIMRILLATYWSYPHMGGLSTYVNELFNGLEGLGHEVEVLAHSPDLKSYYLIKSGRILAKAAVTGPIEERIGSFYREKGMISSNWALSQEIERYGFEAACAYFGFAGYDLIHAQDIVSSRAISRVKPHRIPLITTIHGCFTLEFQRAGILNSPAAINFSSRQEYLGAESSDILIVPSRWIMQLLHGQFGVSSHRMAVIPYGMDLNHFRTRLEIPLQIEVEPTSFIFMCPARLTAVKGHAVLLEALATLRVENSHWECWIVGDGELRQVLEKQCVQLGLERHVLFLGSRSDVPALLKKADAVVLPSNQDNFPFVIMEAQLAQKAIVATDAGGIPEMIEHEKTGLIVPVGDSIKLSHQMKRLLEDSALRQWLGTQAESWGIREWSKDVMISRTLTIYEKAMMGRKDD